jgi:hypothetical protein
MNFAVAIGTYDDEVIFGVGAILADRDDVVQVSDIFVLRAQAAAMHSIHQQLVAYVLRDSSASGHNGTS